jgi:hypothetical protein
LFEKSNSRLFTRGALALLYFLVPALKTPFPFAAAPPLSFVFGHLMAKICRNWKT